jgi:hypothetical protein
LLYIYLPSALFRCLCTVMLLNIRVRVQRL